MQLIQEADRGREQKRTANEKRDIAEDILRYVRQEILMHWPHLEPLFYLLRLQPAEKISIMGTDGSCLFYNATDVISLYLNDFERLSQLMLHSLGHCMLHHICREDKSEDFIYDAVCDICVFHLINRLPGGRQYAGVNIHHGQNNAMLQQEAYIGAKWLYLQCQRDSSLKEQVLRASRDILGDDHKLWKNTKKRKTETNIFIEELWKQGMLQVQEDNKRLAGDLPKAKAEDRIRLLQSAADRAYVSYESIWKKFKRIEETMHMDMDCLNLAWYMTGLQLYGDLPLIEYDEGREEERVKMIAIAIDTSASCDKKMAEQFLTQTQLAVDSLREWQQGRFVLYVIQCDSCIQEERTFRTRAEFDSYILEFRRRGGGGTSFLPVFQRVEQLKSESGDSAFGGLLYFSDGFGEFPQTPPSYETVFVLSEESVHCCPEIPDWITVAALENKRNAEA